MGNKTCREIYITLIELRVHMNSVIGLTELTLDTSLTETQREYLKFALNSAQSVVNTFNSKKIKENVYVLIF